MASYFLDTSAFVKRYHLEIGADRVAALFDRPENQIFISRLTLVETRSAFAVKVRTGSIDEATAAALWIQVLADIASESFEVLPILDVHYQLAETLIGRHAFRNPLRTLDALQLAVALSRSEQAVLDGFVVADQALSKIALAEKLAVVLVA